MLEPSLGFFDQGHDLTDRAFYDTALGPFGLGTKLPALAYRSKAFAELEDEKIWTRSWVCMGHHDRIPAPGDILPYTIGNHGVHLRRRADLKLEGHFNFAQHGGCRFVPRQCQTGKKTTCSFTSCGHSMDRDVMPAGPGGVETPEMYMYLGNNPDRLIPVQIAQLGSLGFANLDVDGHDMDHELGALAAPLRHHLVRPMVRAGRFQQQCSFNWKLFPQGVFGQADVAPAADHDDDAPRSFWGLTFPPGDAPARPLDLSGGVLPAFGPTVDTHLIWIYPNLLLQLRADTMITVVVQPTGLTETLLHVDVFDARASDLAGALPGTSLLEAGRAAVALWTDVAERTQRALAGTANPSPFLSQQVDDGVAPVERSAMLLELQRFIVERLLVRHDYVSRPLYTNPGRSLNAGVNAGAG